MRRCSICYIEKSLDQFYWHSGNQNYSGMCKSCQTLRYGSRRHKNARTVEDWNKELEAQRAWRKNNPEKRRAYENKALKCRPSLREYRRRWVLENKERFLLLRRVAGSRRQARKRSQGGSHSADEWIALVRQNGNKCLRCWYPGNEHSLEQDHIISIAGGGDDNISNIQPLCAACNSWKKEKCIDYRLDRWAPMFQEIRQ